MDLNGVAFNVVFDPSDRRFYWLMVPIQLSPITGLKQNLNCSDPFPREKDFCDQKAVPNHDGSGMDDILRCVAFFLYLFFFYNFFLLFQFYPYGPSGLSSQLKDAKEIVSERFMR